MPAETGALKKAIIITRFPYESSWGGEESHTLSLAKYFTSKGYEVIFFGSCQVLLKKFAELKFPTNKVWGGRMVVTPLELLKSFFLFPLIKWNLTRHFRKLLKQYDVKAVYSLSLNEKILLTPELLRNKIPVTWVEHQEIRGWLLQNPWRKLYRQLSDAVRIVPISKTNQQRLIAELKVDQKNMVDITNGVDIEGMSRIPRATQKNLLVCANRFVPKKGVMDFLYTLPILFLEQPTLEVVVVGEGEEEMMMKEYIQKNLAGKKIQIIPFLKKENWYELLSKCDVFVGTARDTNETFSLSTAEALAAGCKVVVTKCSGIADYLQDGVEAFLAEPMKSESLKENIEKALSGSDDMRQRAMAKAKDQFDDKNMLERYESVILRP